MNGSAGPKIIVLYKISNIKGEEGAYNAFELPGPPGGVSLSSVKNTCHALRSLSSAGADGYHWRVRVDDKSKGAASGSTPPKYSWWDVQDEAAKLPLKQVGFSELQHLLAPPRKSASEYNSSSGPSTKGVVRSLGKAMNKVAASVEGANHHSSTFDGPGGPKIPILMFKLLDLGKLHDEFDARCNIPKRAAGPGAAVASSTSSRTQATPQRQPQQHQTSQHQRTPQTNPTPKPIHRQPKPVEGSLMDFGPGPSKPHHSHSAPASFGAASATTTTSKPNETRAQKLKREYEKKNKTENRVWDDVDQRWVAVEVKNGATVSRGSTSAPPGVSNAAASATSTKKSKAVSLDKVNTTGKSADVAAAVNQRVNDMKESQEKAVTQIRDREEAKKKSEAEEDVVRQKLEPTIKIWSEEHGKKKQLRALLASLHTILWTGAKWKQINLGDLLDDKKCKLAYHKASRVVHPDKTMKLPPEQRFLAKRIFDALSQAKTEFDNSK